MKKITDFFGRPKIAFTIILIFFGGIWGLTFSAAVTSCSTEKSHETKPIHNNRRYEINTEKIDGHEYLIFRTSAGSGIQALHSESCPCKIKNIEKQ